MPAFCSGRPFDICSLVAAGHSNNISDGMKGRYKWCLRHNRCLTGQFASRIKPSHDGDDEVCDLEHNTFEPVASSVLKR